MTTLIKHDALHGDHAVRTLGEPAGILAAPEPSAEQAYISALTQEVEDLRSALLASAATGEAAAAEAYRNGREDAEAQFVSDQTQSLAAFELGVDAAVVSVGEQWARLQPLSLAIAATALERVFAAESSYADLVGDAVRAQMRGLRAEAVLGMRVSAKDFSDLDSLQALARRTGIAVDVVADDALSAGECRMQLRLGSIELSVPQYWDALQARCRAILAEALA